MVATSKEVFRIKLEVAREKTAVIKKVNTQIKNIHIPPVEVLFPALNAALATLGFAITWFLAYSLRF